MTQVSTDISSADDSDFEWLIVGDLVNLRGKLEAVRYSNGGQSWHPGPNLVVTFADWSMLSASIQTEEIARSICVPLGTYVCIKARIMNEDKELEAIAIWELANPVPIPLIDTPQRTTVSGTLTNQPTKEPTHG